MLRRLLAFKSLIFSPEFVNPSQAIGRNFTTCKSQYTFVRNEANRCEISFMSNDGSTNRVELHVDSCKDPFEVKFYKKTSIPNSAEATELSHIFTKLNNKYE